MHHGAICAGVAPEGCAAAYATRDELNEAYVRVAIIEERLAHTATKSWVLGGALSVLTGVLVALWWITQQYLAPLLNLANH